MSTGFFITNLTGKLMSDVVNQNVFKKLYIYISIQNQSRVKNIELVSKKIVDMYSSSYSLFRNLDVRIILKELKRDDKIIPLTDYNVDVIFLPKTFDKEKKHAFKINHNLPVIYVDDLVDEEDNIFVTDGNIYENVVLGGTFDRFHIGHKILLSEALLRCSKKLTVGVTAGDMLKGKKLYELIQPCTERIKAVEIFIKEVDTSVEYEVVPITDMFGPTKTDPNFNMIVVSSETKKGGLKVNEIRKQNGLNELDIHEVKLVKDSKRSNTEEEEKISSSNIRMRLLGTYIKPPKVNGSVSPKPYLIGLTGGIASGKSSISEYLKRLGAAVIDCDKIAHKLYAPSTEIYAELIKIFGKEIVSTSGDIDRKALGAIVFSNLEKLDILNNLMWPAILKKAITECEWLYTEENKNVVILEAAVLLKAGWHKIVHEVWATIIPQQEAITRLQARNSFTEEEATLRVKAQPSNQEFVDIANVVFSSLWSYEFTRQQVDKAWNAVQNKLKNN